MKIGLVQYNPVWENKEANKEKLLRLLDSISENVDVLIFPEMTLMGFTMKSSEMAEYIEDESFSFFKNTANEKAANIFAGITTKENGNIFNSLIHISRNGKIQATYHKIHPFSASGEDFNYARGTQPIISTIDEWKAGLSICYDLRFPELFRYYGKERVELIINIANWPNSRIDHWRTLLKARAIENQCYVAGVNRVGNDLKSYYPGFSSVYSPMGEEIIVLGDEEKIGIAEIDINKVEAVRKQYPFLNDITLV